MLPDTPETSESEKAISFSKNPPRTDENLQSKNFTQEFNT